MTAEEIRKLQDHEAKTTMVDYSNSRTFWLSEIAAQLAERNQGQDNSNQSFIEQLVEAVRKSADERDAKYFAELKVRDDAYLNRYEELQKRLRGLEERMSGGTGTLQ